MYYISAITDFPLSLSDIIARWYGALHWFEKEGKIELKKKKKT